MLIAKYAELEEEDVQDIDRNMKKPISGENLFEEFFEQIKFESKSGRCAECVFYGSDFLYGVREHWKMWAISRQFPRMVTQDMKLQDLGQLQGSLRLVLQGDLKILKNFKDQRLCIARTRRTSKRGTFHQDATVPHPGASKSRGRHANWHDISRAAHEDNFGAIKPGRATHGKTRNNTSWERRNEKLGTSINPIREQTSGVQQLDPVKS